MSKPLQLGPSRCQGDGFPQAEQDTAALRQSARTQQPPPGPELRRRTPNQTCATADPQPPRPPPNSREIWARARSTIARSNALAVMWHRPWNRPLPARRWGKEGGREGGGRSCAAAPCPGPAPGMVLAAGAGPWRRAQVGKAAFNVFGPGLAHSVQVWAFLSSRAFLP